MKTRVVLVDDQSSVRQMLALVLRQQGGFEVVGETGNGGHALPMCEELNPDLLILDIILTGLSGAKVLRNIRAARLSTKVLFYSRTSDRVHIMDALRLRPDGFVSKADTLETLCEAARTVATGSLFFSPSVAGHLMSFRDPHVGRPLSLREREVLQLVAGSRSSKEIATALGVAAKTVDRHRERIMLKLALHDVAALTRYALHEGLIE